MDNKGLISELKSYVRLEDAMEFSGIQFVSKAGDAWKADCFLHQEKVPSLTVSPRKGLYHCFSTGCTASGDLITFYQQFHKLDMEEALLKLAEDFGVDASPFQKLTPEEKEKQRLMKLQRDVSSALTNFLLRSDRAVKAREYVKNRGVSIETIKAFGVGYSPSINTVVAIAKEKGAKPADIKDLEFDRALSYRDKITFPVVHPGGRGHIHYSGTVGKAMVGTPKYVGPTTRHPLRWDGAMFGLQVARNSIAQTHNLVLVEGFFDALTLHSYGVRNSVCMLGSSPQQSQLEVLKSVHATHATVVFDADAAGEAGVKKLVAGGGSGIHLRMGLLPEGDPDDYVKKYGADAFRGVVDQAVSISDYLVGQVVEELSAGSVETKSAALERVVEQVRTLPTHEAALVLAEVSRLSGVLPDDLRDLLASSSDQDRIIRSEFALISSCIHDDTVFMQAKVRIGGKDVWLLRKHRYLWEGVLALRKAGAESVTPDLLREQLEEKANFNGSIDALFGDYAGNGEFYLSEVYDSYMRRVLKAAAKKLGAAAENKDKEVGNIVAEHLACVSSDVSASTVKIEFTAAEQVEGAMSYIHTRMDAAGEMPGINLGEEWKQIMQATLGLQPDHLWLLAALPKAGKSTVLLNWALNISVAQKIPSLVVNLEMSERDIALRGLSILSGISNTRLRMGAIGGAEKEALDDIAKEYHASPLHIVNGSSLTLHELLGVMRKFVYVHGVKAIFVDYMQLVRVHGKAAYWEKHAEISSELKGAAMSLHVPVVAASQLNRASLEGVGGGALNMTGGIKGAQDCDVAFELRRRTQKELEKDGAGSHILNVELNRHGPGDVFTKLLMNRETLHCQEA